MENLKLGHVIMEKISYDKEGNEISYRSESNGDSDNPYICNSTTEFKEDTIDVVTKEKVTFDNNSPYSTTQYAASFIDNKFGNSIGYKKNEGVGYKTAKVETSNDDSIETYYEEDGKGNFFEANKIATLNIEDSNGIKHTLICKISSDKVSIDGVNCEVSHIKENDEFRSEKECEYDEEKGWRKYRDVEVVKSLEKDITEEIVYDIDGNECTSETSTRTYSLDNTEDLKVYTDENYVKGKLVSKYEHVEETTHHEDGSRDETFIKKFYINDSNK